MTTTWANDTDTRDFLQLLQRGSPPVGNAKPEDVRWEDLSLEWPGQFLPFCRESLPGNATEEGRAKRHSFGTLIQPYLKSTGRFVSYAG